MIEAEHHFSNGVLLHADATAKATVDRARELFIAVDKSIVLIGADPPYGEITGEKWDTCEAITGCKPGTEEAQTKFVNWMLEWTNLWSEVLAPGGAFYVWGGVGIPRFRPFYEYLNRVEFETDLVVAHHITWKKKRAYGLAYNYLFTREEVVYLCKGDPKKPRCFHVPLTDKLRGYKGYNKDFPAKSDFLRRSSVWDEGDLTGTAEAAAQAEVTGESVYLLGDVWDETEILRGKRHPCEKAKRVCEIPIEVHTDPGDGVIDLFAGSASFSEAAQRLGRGFLAVERDADEVAKIRGRMT
jgi:DNA modification methylase